MAYTPNPFNTVQPTDEVFAGTAAAEFRAMKVALLGLDGSASYRGEWTTFVSGLGTHPANQGDTFTHQNAMWMLKISVADVETIPPLSSDTVNWFKLYPNELVVSSINSGQLAGFRNKLLNGRMEFQQLPVAAVAAGTTSYTLDQWVTSNGSGGALATAQVADGPSLDLPFSHRITVTTADAAIAVGDFAWFGQPVEGWNVRDFQGRTFTYSFWMKASKVGVYTVAFKNAAGSRTRLYEVTVLAANTWEQKTVTVSGGLPASGVWDFQSGVGLYAQIALAAGTTWQSAAGAWQNGNYVGTANQVNLLDTIGATLFVTGGQLEIGDQATPFEHRDLGLEERMLMRYFEKGTMYNVGVCTNGVVFGTPIGFKTRKRAAPGMTATGVVSSIGVAGAAFPIINTDGAVYQVTANATGGGSLGLSYEANARM